MSLMGVHDSEKLSQSADLHAALHPNQFFRQARLLQGDSRPVTRNHSGETRDPETANPA